MKFSKRKPNNNETLSIFLQAREKHFNRNRKYAQLTVATLNVKNIIRDEKNSTGASMQAISNAVFSSMPFGLNFEGQVSKQKVFCDVA